MVICFEFHFGQSPWKLLCVKLSLCVSEWCKVSVSETSALLSWLLRAYQDLYLNGIKFVSKALCCCSLILQCSTISSLQRGLPLKITYLCAYMDSFYFNRVFLHFFYYHLCMYIDMYNRQTQYTSYLKMNT